MSFPSRNTYLFVIIIIPVQKKTNKSFDMKIQK